MTEPLMQYCFISRGFSLHLVQLNMHVVWDSFSFQIFFSIPFLLFSSKKEYKTICRGPISEETIDNLCMPLNHFNFQIIVPFYSYILSLPPSLKKKKKKIGIWELFNYFSSFCIYFHYMHSYWRLVNYSFM